MKKNFFLIAILTTLIAQAQNKSKVKFVYSNVNNMQVIVGDKSSGIGLESIHGVKWKNNFSIGVGAAYETHQVASIPVFIDIRKSFGKKNSQPFIYANAGRNYTLRTDNYPKTWSWNNADAYTFKSSYYYAMGIGIARKINKNSKLLFSLGVSFKEFKYAYNYSWIWNTDFLPNYVYDYKFNRYCFKIGLEL